MNQPPNVRMVKIAKLDRSHPSRQIDRRHVGELAASIRDNGLLHPVIVDDNHVVLAGHHRVAAHELIGLDEIPATVISLGEIKKQLATIDENLMRLNLTSLQRGQAIAKRKELYEALHPGTKQGPAQARGSNKKQGKATGSDVSADSALTFVDDTASKTGRSKRSVQVDAQIGSSLTPDEVSELQGTPAENNQSVLLRIAQEKDPVRRRTLIDAAKEPEEKAPKRNGGRKRDPGSDDLDRRIAELYDSKPGKEISAILGVPLWRVNQAASRLGLSKGHGNKRRKNPLESVHKGLIKCFAVVENWLAEDAVWRGRKATPEEHQGLLVELAKLQSQIGKFKRDLGKEYGR